MKEVKGALTLLLAASAAVALACGSGEEITIVGDWTCEDQVLPGKDGIGMQLVDQRLRIADTGNSVQEATFKIDLPNDADFGSVAGSEALFERRVTSTWTATTEQFCQTVVDGSLTPENDAAWTFETEAGVSASFDRQLLTGDTGCMSIVAHSANVLVLDDGKGQSMTCRRGP